MTIKFNINEEELKKNKKKSNAPGNLKNELRKLEIELYRVQRKQPIDSEKIELLTRKISGLKSSITDPTLSDRSISDLSESESLISKYGVEGYNKPKRTPSHKTKSHLVVAKKGDTIKVIRFGAQGAKGSPKKEGESKKYRKRREGFVARHKAQNPGGLKNKLSALYWANKVKW
jgi:hypothetical protein